MKRNELFRASLPLLFIATSLSSFASLARYTSPIPPAPSGDKMT